MRPDVLPKVVLKGDEAREKIDKGATIVYETARAAYGPAAGNVMYEQKWPIGMPKISRDGVTNLRQLADKDRAANLTIKAIVQASEKNNAIVGDGTTAVAILAYHFYMAARKLVAAGHNQMVVARKIEQASLTAIEYIDSIKRELSEGELLSVAKVACGDDAIAELLADTVAQVGSEGGITVEEHGGLGVYAEVIDGFYMRKGFTTVDLVKDGGTLSSDFENVPILLLDKTITDGREMAQILNKIKGAGHNEVLILGEVIHDALDVLIKQHSGKILIPTLANIPATSGMKSIVLDDLAIITGGRVYKHGDNPQDFDIEYLGAAERALVDELSTTILGGAGEAADVQKRISELEGQLASEVLPTTVTVLKDRIARLKGKIGIVKVGAPTDIDREELRLRVDDAVCALQAARKEGTVPGGGTTLARVTNTDFDSVFAQLFIELMNNAGEKAEYRLGKILEKPIGFGYDLKNLTDDPIDLNQAGILDPTLVIKEIVRNAASVASKLITTSVTITYSDDIVENLIKK